MKKFALAVMLFLATAGIAVAQVPGGSVVITRESQNAYGRTYTRTTARYYGVHPYPGNRPAGTKATVKSNGVMVITGSVVKTPYTPQRGRTAPR